MRKPDYRGGGIVNLMSSIIQARGGRSENAALELLSVAELSPATNIILLVIDGLGADWLARHSPDGILSQASRGAITSVFPPTTAAAITTFLTGDAPLQHGLTGWFTYLRELGCVMTVLPGTPRYGGVSYRQAGIDPIKLFGHTSVFERIRARGVTVSPDFIARSDFNLAHTAGSEILPYSDLRDMFRQTLRALRPRRGWGRPVEPEPGYLYLYWPTLDSLGHVFGMESTETVKHLDEIERALEDFLRAAAGTDSLMVVTADHGQIDTTPADVIDLAEHRELADALVLPLCGEPRAAFCYLRPDRAGSFEEYCGARLGEEVRLVHSRQLVEEGLFGLGRPHPRFMERIGDVCLMPFGRGTVRLTLPSETPQRQIGVHGGLSEAELMVPLCVLRP